MFVNYEFTAMWWNAFVRGEYKETKIEWHRCVTFCICFQLKYDDDCASSIVIRWIFRVRAYKIYFIYTRNKKIW